MRSIRLVAMSAALALCGCAPQSATVRTALECPATSGDLVLTSAQADGRACKYRGPQDSEVVLRLVAVPDTVPAALASIEDEVWAGRRAAAVNWVKVAPNGAIGVAVEGEPPVILAKPPYPLVRTDRNDVLVGPLRVEGDPAFAVTQYERPMPLRGTRLGAPAQGMVRGLVHKGDRLPGGYRTFAYEAAGPTAGPMAVAFLRSRASLNELPADVRDLVRKNGGV